MGLKPLRHHPITLADCLLLWEPKQGSPFLTVPGSVHIAQVGINTGKQEQLRDGPRSIMNCLPVRPGVRHIDSFPVSTLCGLPERDIVAAYEHAWGSSTVYPAWMYCARCQVELAELGYRLSKDLGGDPQYLHYRMQNFTIRVHPDHPGAGASIAALLHYHQGDHRLADVVRSIVELGASTVIENEGQQQERVHYRYVTWEDEAVV